MTSIFFKLVSVLALSMVLSFPNGLKAGTNQHEDFRDIHMIMNYGLTMILDGSSLIMMAEMDIDTAVEKDPLVHGNKMIDEGKALLNRALTGPVMVKKHMEGQDKTKKMTLTHQLGELMLKQAYSRDIMQPTGSKSDTVIKLHVMHLEEAHALIMAAQGANMVISGKGGTNNDLNRFSIEQGRRMMTDAKTILNNLLNGNTLKELEKEVLPPEEEKILKATKEQLINSIDIANLLIQMEYE